MNQSAPNADVPSTDFFRFLSRRSSAEKNIDFEIATKRKNSFLIGTKDQEAERPPLPSRGGFAADCSGREKNLLLYGRNFLRNQTVSDM
ncbi:MAG: hypothetical protein M0017_06825 [Desulfobacteraceae bacterium]|nr:hypothetical protein [Desulfobacteraceae bacterium]